MDGIKILGLVCADGGGSAKNNEEYYGKRKEKYIFHTGAIKCILSMEIRMRRQYQSTAIIGQYSIFRRIPLRTILQVAFLILLRARPAWFVLRLLKIESIALSQISFLGHL